MSLVCAGLDFSYGDRSILNQVSFTVFDGVFCGLLGRNGSGKTTLLYCLNGLLRPQRGRIDIDGLDIGRAGRKAVARTVSLVPQEHVEIFPFSVLDVVVMGRTTYLSFARGPGNADYRAAYEILQQLKISALAERNFNKISGGERQMVLLARALVQSSSTLLLDEPTNHLDFKNQYVFLDRIKTLCRRKGIRVIAAMHDPNLARLFADQVVMLKDGRVLAEGPVSDVMNVHQVSRLYDAETRRFDLSSGKHFFLPDFVCDSKAEASVSPSPVVLVSGLKQSGKSTVIEGFLKSIEKRGIRVAGILAKGLWKEGLREGFDLVDLSDGSIVPLARRIPKEDPNRTVNFDFLSEGIQAGWQALSPERCKDADVVILDEMGKLEAMGKGWARAVEPLLALGRPLYIWAVRKDVQGEIEKRWNLRYPTIIDVDGPDPLKRLQAICEETLNKLSESAG